MELRHLRYFLAVAEELHFGRAAQRLHMAQPPLSQQIRKLEEELGVQLFQRTKRRVQLTDAGRAFMEEARLTLLQAEQSVRTAQRAARGEVGRLRVGFVDSAAFSVLPHILRVFRERFPNVELTLSESGSVEQVAALRERRIHVGFIRPPVSEDSLILEPILREPFVVVLPGRHLLARRARVPLKALAREPFVIFPRHLGQTLYDHIVSLCGRAGFSPRIAQEASRAQTVVSLVAAGIGVALLPASCQNLRRVGTVYKPIDGPSPKLELTLAWRRDYNSPVLNAFLNVSREVAGQMAKA